MSWLELKSPALKQYLANWCDVRGPRKTAAIESFEDFERSVAQEFLATVGASKERECVFTFVGPTVQALYPGCMTGMRISEISPITKRIGISRPFQEVLSARLPISRRHRFEELNAKRYFEQLLLPFVDKDFDVRRVVVVVDGYVADKAAAQ